MWPEDWQVTYANNNIPVIQISYKQILVMLDSDFKLFRCIQAGMSSIHVPPPQEPFDAKFFVFVMSRGGLIGYRIDEIRLVFSIAHETDVRWRGSPESTNPGISIPSRLNTRLKNGNTVNMGIQPIPVSARMNHGTKREAQSTSTKI